jgi:hypothetical protein
MRDEVKPRSGNRHERDPDFARQVRLDKVALAIANKHSANPDGHLVQTNPGMRALMDMRAAKSNGE